MIRDVAAMNASLDNDYGTTAGPSSPSAHELALFVGDPLDDGVEIAGGGYARVTVDPADWAPAVDGSKATTSPVQFPDATAEWDEAPTHWALYSADDSSTMWDCAPLTDLLEVTAAGPGPAVQIAVFYDDSVEEA